MISDYRCVGVSALIELSLIFTEDLRDPALIRHYVSQLTPAERARYESFHFERDRINHLAARVAVREALSELVDVSPSDWLFDADANGKPRIAGPSIGQDLNFNVTHTDGLVLVGITRAGAIGVDVESLARPVSLELADQCFAPSEVAALRGLPKEKRAARLLELWTLKESFVKACGLGLALPMDSFAVEFAPSGEIGLELGLMSPHAGHAWQLWRFEAGARHIAAVCLQRQTSRQVELSAVRRVPGISRRPWHLGEATNDDRR